MFAMVEHVSSTPVDCGRELFFQVLRSEKVARICGEIAALQASLTPETPEEERKKVAEAIALKKKGLSGFCFHAHFDDKRSNKGAHPSGLYMTDLDKLTMPPKELWEQYREGAIAAGVVLAHITPSTHGLRMVGRIPQGMTLVEAQQWLVRQLGIEDYDGCVKDLARVSYAVPESYVLYLNEEGMFNETSTQQFNIPATQQGEISTSQQPLLFDTVPYPDIVTRLLAHYGYQDAPAEGDRNNTVYQMARDLRHICDFRLDNLLRILPRYGLSEEEVATTVKSALESPRPTQRPAHLQAIITQLKEEQTAIKGDFTPKEQAENEEAVKLAMLQKLPPLPRFWKLLVKSYPENFRPAVIMASLPILGTLATHFRFLYNSGTELHSLSFITSIIAPQATGKSFTSKLVKRLMAPIIEQDDRYRDMEQAYLLQKAEAKNSKKQPEPPKTQVRILSDTISNAMLYQRLRDSAGMHCFINSPEIDTIAKSNAAGAWSRKDDLFRRAFDNERSGQEYKSENSTLAVLEVYLNLLFAGTPQATGRFFRDAENGLNSRVAFVNLPDMLGMPRSHVLPLTEREEAEIQEATRMLMAIEDETPVDLRRLDRVMDQWGEAHRLNFLMSQDNPAEEILRRRAAVIGFRAGALAYLLCDRKESKLVLDFACWVAEFVLQQQLKTFGKQLNEAYARPMFADAKGGYQRGGESGATREGKVVNLLKELPIEFTREELKQARMANGQGDRVDMVLKRWLESGMIEEVEKHKKWKVTYTW